MHLPTIWVPPPASTEVERYQLLIKFRPIDAVNSSKHFIHKKSPPWLRNAIESLKLRNDIIFKPTDKNMGISVQLRTPYENECNKQLSGITVYKPINNNYPGMMSLVWAKLRNNRLREYKYYDDAEHESPTRLAKYLLQLEGNKKFYVIRCFTLL